MKAYPLGPLLSAREFREDAAAREVSKARSRVEEAKEKLAAARAELVRYREWRPGEEARLFEEIRGRLMPQSGLDRHRDDIALLRQGEINREDACRAAEAAVAAAEAELDKARAAYGEAVKDKRKIEEHRSRWLAEEAKLAEAAEEAELEDFHSRSVEE